MKFPKFKLKKKLSKLIYPALILLILVPTITLLFNPSKVYADPNSAVDSQLEQEYKSWAAFGYLSQCIAHVQDTLSKASDSDDYTTAAYSAGWGINSTHSNPNVGKILDSQDGYLNCDSGGDFMIAAREAGYDSIEQFMNEYYPKTGNCDGNDCPHTSRESQMTRIEQHIKDKNWGGLTDNNSPRTLSDEAQYWYWKTLFLGSPCNAKHYDNADDPSYKSHDVDRKDASMNVYIINNGDLTGKTYTVWSYDIPTNNTYDEMGAKLNTDMRTIDVNDGNPMNESCKQIGNHMSKTSGDKYLALLNQKITECTNAGTAADACKTTITTPTTGGNNPQISKDDIVANCTISINPITWIMCALIKGFTEAVNQMDKEITSMLAVKSSDYFNESNQTGTNFKTMWKTVRTISIGLLVIFSLIMIISTAIGVGPFDAYTVKKVMPRIIIVTILIPLSWSLVIAMIDISSILGFGIRGLIEAPFPKAVSIGGGQLTLGAGGLAISGLILGLPGLLSFLAGAFLAVMIAFVTLILRQIVIILLAVLAPVALVMFILPNTSKAAKFWWESFSKALLVFPIISGFIAMGRVFATVANEGTNNQGPGTVQGLIAFIAYFAPYFMIPTAFKMAGGVLGNLTGAVNDRGKGAFDRLKKFRQGQSQKNIAGIQKGTRFNPDGKLSALNNPLRQASQLNKAGFRPSRMRAKLSSATANADIAQAMEDIEKNDNIKPIMNDDDMLKAFEADTSYEAIEKRLRDTGRFGAQGSQELANAVATVQNAQRGTTARQRQIIGGVGRAATGTGFDTTADMLEAATAASGGNPSVRNAMIAQMRSASERVGRFDLSAPGHVATVSAAEDLARGYHINDDGSHTAVDRDSINRQMRAEAMRTVGAGKLVQGKPAAVRDLATGLATDYQAAVSAGDIDGAAELAGQLVSLRSASGSATPEGRQHINAALAAAGVDEGAINPQTGMAVSVDEQLGNQLAKVAAAQYHSTSGIAPTAAEFSVLEQQATQTVRTRAGAYDAGGGNRTPEQLRASRPPEETT